MTKPPPHQEPPVPWKEAGWGGGGGWRGPQLSEKSLSKLGGTSPVC